MGDILEYYLLSKVIRLISQISQLLYGFITLVDVIYSDKGKCYCSFRAFSLGRYTEFLKDKVDVMVK